VRDRLTGRKKRRRDVQAVASAEDGDLILPARPPEQFVEELQLTG
jgi:hypothetical protein